MGGAAGTIYGMAAGSCAGTVLVWSQFRKAYAEHNAATATVLHG